MKQITGERREVLECLQATDSEMQVCEIARRLGKNPAAVGYLLGKMRRDGLVESPHYGKYRNTQSPKSLESPQSLKSPKTRHVSSLGGAPQSSRHDSEGC